MIKNTQASEIQLKRTIERLKEMAPGYRLKWNRNEVDIKGNVGMYELIGPDNKVHYRRSSLIDINSLF